MADFLEEVSSGQRYLLTADTATLGREEGCEILLDHASVSRRHCTFVRQAEGWTIRDNGSRNGTEVGGQRLIANRAVPLPANARLRVGQVELVLRSGAAGDVDKAPPAALSLLERAKAVQAEAPAVPVADVDRFAATEFSLERFLPNAGQGVSEDRPLDALLSELMFRAQGALFPGQPIDNLLQSLLEIVVAYVPAARASVHLWNPDLDDLDEGITLDAGGDARRAFVLSTGVAEKVMRERKAVLIRDVASDAEFKSRKSLVRLGITSAVAAPLFDGDDILGVLCADITDGTRELGENDLAVLTVLAAIAGTMLVAAQMISSLMRNEAELRDEIAALRERLAAVPAM